MKVHTMGRLRFDGMTEAEWLTNSDPDALLRFAAARLSPRQATLFACGCCRRLWSLVGDERWREVVRLREREAGGEDVAPAVTAVYQAYQEDAGTGRHPLWPPLTPFINLAQPGFSSPELLGHLARMARRGAGAGAALAARAAGELRGQQASAKREAERAEAVAQCELLRELVGNPFRAPVRLNEPRGN